MYESIKTDRLYELIVQRIESQILSGVLIPGDRLPSERELGDQFAVSRTSVREAMKALAQSGLVEIYPGRGTFVTNGTSRAIRQSLSFMVKIESRKAIRDLVEVREILEPTIAAIAAERANAEDLDSMRAAIATMDANLDNRAAFIKGDLQFHHALAQSTHNELILMLVDAFLDSLRDSQRRTSRSEGAIQRAQRHHKSIMDAVLQGNPELARERMREHMKQVRRDSEVVLERTKRD